MEPTMNEEVLSEPQRTALSILQLAIRAGARSHTSVRCIPPTMRRELATRGLVEVRDVGSVWGQRLFLTEAGTAALRKRA
jgi:hypothetical protein